MRKIIIVLLIVIAVVGIGVGVSYPIRYKMQLDSNNSELEDLSSMRRRVMEEQHVGLDFESGSLPREGEAEPAKDAAEAVPAETGVEADAEGMPQSPRARGETPEPSAAPEGVAQTQTPDEMGVAQPVETGENPPAGAVENPPVETGESVPAEMGENPPVETGESVSAEMGENPPAETVENPPMETVENPPVVTAEAQPAEAATQGTQPPEAVGTQPPAEASNIEAAPEAPVITPTPGIMDLIINDVITPTDTPAASSTPVPVTPSPSPTPDRSVQYAVDSYKSKAKVQLDEDLILPELRDIYALNHDLVGWLYIEDTNIDYPVVQSLRDRTFYLSHDFYGNSNANGQIIMEDKCDPYTPSYNLVFSGHHMNSGAMFGQLGKYKDKSYWETHKIVEFDSLMARKRYVIFAAFYSADYDDYEKGFRYSADIQYEMDADLWLGEIQANKIYDTGIEAEFGDEFITLTTCDHSRRRDGRFVLVARRIREGEKIL